MRRKPKRRTRAGLLTRDQVWNIIRPYANQLYDWVIESWDWVQTILDQDSERRATLDEGTVYSMVYNRFVFLMKSGLSSDSKVEFHAVGRMTRAQIRSEIALRFKKLDPRLRSKNIGTHNQDIIYNQQLELDGISTKLTNITLGYVTDKANTRIKYVYFTCPKGYSHNAWNIRLNEESEGGSLQFSPQDIDGGPSAPLIAAKHGDKAVGQ